MPVPQSISRIHDHGIEIIHFRGVSYTLSQALKALPGTTLTPKDSIMVDLAGAEYVKTAHLYLARWLSVEGWLWFGQHGLTHSVRGLPRTARVKITFDSHRPLQENSRETLYHPLFMTQPTVAPVRVPVTWKTDVKRLRQAIKQRGMTHHYTLIVNAPSSYPGVATITRHVLRGAPWFTHVEGEDSPGLEMLEVPDAAGWLRHADHASWAYAREMAPILNHGVLINACHSELGLTALPYWLPFASRMTVLERDYMQDHHEQHMYLVIPGYAQRRALEIMKAYSRRHTTRSEYADQSPTLRRQRIDEAPEILREEGMDTDRYYEIQRERKALDKRSSMADTNPDASEEDIQRAIAKVTAGIPSPEEQRHQRISNLLTRPTFDDTRPVESEVQDEESRDPRNGTMFWYLHIKDLFDEEALDCINHGGSPGDPDQAIAWRGYPERLINAPDAPILAVRVPLTQELAVFTADLDTALIAEKAYGTSAEAQRSRNREFLEISSLPWVAATVWTDYETRGRQKGSGKRRARHEYDSGGIGVHLQHRAASIFSNLMYEFMPDAGTGKGAMMPVAGIEDAAKEVDWHRHYTNEPMLFFALINYVRAYREFEEFNPLPDLDIPMLRNPGLIETNRPGWNYRDHKNTQPS